jgi:hypothetical protein
MINFVCNQNIRSWNMDGTILKGQIQSKSFSLLEPSRSQDARQSTASPQLNRSSNRPLHKMQGKAASPRQQLLQWAEKYPDLMHIRQEDASHQVAMQGSVTSKFCFVPRGKSAWSSRLFRVLFAKCVPVILNDDYEIPFLGLMENQDNW